MCFLCTKILNFSGSFALRTCTGCQQSKNVLDKYWQCCCCLFICTPPVFLLYRSFAESDQIWRGMIGLIWKIDSLSSSATSRAREVFVIRQYFFFFKFSFTLLLLYSSFLALFFFLFRLHLGGAGHQTDRYLLRLFSCFQPFSNGGKKRHKFLLEVP